MICEQQPERIVNSQLWHHMQWQPAGEQFNSNKIAAPTPGLPPPSVAASGKCKYVKMRTQRAFRASRKLTRRLHEVKIDYPGINNYSQFSYDGLWRNTKIVETTSGSVTSTKQFVWCSESRCEERDASSAISAQFFTLGEKISGNSRFFTADHLANDPNFASRFGQVNVGAEGVVFSPLFTSSIREMTDATGAIQSQLSYDAYGRVVQVQGSQAPDFQFGDYYFHSASGLNLTLTRAYSSRLGRFINRDTIEEDGGINLFTYMNNNPTVGVDPDGTCAVVVVVVVGGDAVMGATGSAMAAAAAAAAGTMAGQAISDMIRAMSDAANSDKDKEKSKGGYKSQTDRMRDPWNQKCNVRRACCSIKCGGEKDFDACMRKCMKECGWPIKVRH